MNENNIFEEVKNSSAEGGENAGSEPIVNTEPELTPEEQAIIKKRRRKKKTIIALSITAAVILLIANLLIYGVLEIGKSSKDGSLWIGSSNYAKSGHIYLIGESHSVDKILAEELRIWKDLYHNEGMRHYFVEYSYFTAELLNLWMQAEDNTILWEIYNDWEGTLAHNMVVYNFYVSIKETCPETIFHGTDIGHQYKTTGARYLKYLEDNGLTDTENYRLALESIEQGKKYYTGNNGEKDHDYREATMAANFIREYDKLDGLSVFGVYGSAHTNYPAYGWNCKETLTMTTTIVQTYGYDSVEVNNLSLAYQKGELN